MKERGREKATFWCLFTFCGWKTTLKDEGVSNKKKRKKEQLFSEGRRGENSHYTCQNGGVWNLGRIFLSLCGRKDGENEGWTDGNMNERRLKRTEGRREEKMVGLEMSNRCVLFSYEIFRFLEQVPTPFQNGSFFPKPTRSNGKTGRTDVRSITTSWEAIFAV